MADSLFGLTSAYREICGELFEAPAELIHEHVFQLYLAIPLWGLIVWWIWNLASIQWAVDPGYFSYLALAVLAVAGWTYAVTAVALKFCSWAIFTVVIVLVGILILCLSAIPALVFGIAVVFNLLLWIPRAAIMSIEVLVRAVLAVVFLGILLSVSPDYLWSRLFVFRPRRYRIPGPVCEAPCGSKNGTLCETCSGLIRLSPLLLGRAYPFVRPVEEYKHLTADGLRVSATQCHLCSFLLWSSKTSQLETPRRHEPSNYGAISHNPALRVSVRHDQALGYRPRLRIWLEVGGVPAGDGLAVRCSRGGSTALSICRGSCGTKSPQALRQAKNWIKSCSKWHPKCRQSSIHTNAAFIPTRLVEVTSSVEGRGVKARLVETTRGKRALFQPYIALSHCWGKSSNSPDFSKLTLENIAELREAICFDWLTTNFKDAIYITVALGARYIWIDSLCIIQGDDKDWKTESANMGRIYAGALCTISATASLFAIVEYVG